MARASSSAGKAPFLSPGLAEFLRRRVTEAAGLLVLAIGLALLLTLVSYAPTDPSHNVSKPPGAPVKNLLGGYGAITADWLLRGLGLGGVGLAAVISAWGWRILTRRGMSPLLPRIAVTPVGLVLLAAACAGIAAPEAWPLKHAGLGGFIGKPVLGGLMRLPNHLGLPLGESLTALVCAVLAILLLAYALGASLREWRAAVGMLAIAGRHTVRGGWRGLAAVRRSLRFKRPTLRLARAEEGPGERAEPRVSRREQLVETEPGEAAEAAARASVEGTETKRPRTPKPKARGGSAARLEDGYALPPLDLLKLPPLGSQLGMIDEDALQANARQLESVLEDFGVRGEIVKVRPGPVVTLYELEPAPGTKASRVIGLADDIARYMSAVSVRCAVVPGRNVIGIELPNARRETVYLRELLGHSAYSAANGGLPLVLGKDIGGGPVVVSLERMPHLLIAGTTGSGKSVAINTMILSLLYRLTPEQCRFIMIDPKMLELSVYDDIPHLLAPVVTEPRKAVVALKWVVREMENRYRSMSTLGVRNIAGYNARIEEAKGKGEVLTRRVQTGFDPETGKPVFEEQMLDMRPLPFIVVVVDEMADLMLVAGKDIEAAIQRLAQMARAAGIHIIMATQRPSVDVITGTIKANFPTRVSFQVTSKIDSSTILGEGGAEQLLGQGDMLYMAGGGRISRVHGPLVSDAEVEEAVAFLKAQGTPIYVDGITEEDGLAEGGAPFGEGAGEEDGDDLYQQAVALVAREKKASTSFIQRHLQIGYNRAARIIERMEVDGIVSSSNHVGKREVLIGGGVD